MTIIASWNVNSVKARLPSVLKWLGQINPDIVLFQELKCTTQSFPYDIFEDLGYNIAVAGQKTYNGVAIFSKYPLEDVIIGLPGNQDDSQARYIEAVIGSYRVASVYVPNGMEIGSSKYLYKLNFMSHLQNHLQQRLRWEEAFIIGGDYNIAPYEIDGYNSIAFQQEHILCSRAEQEALRKILFTGYTDAFRALHPHQAHIYTWWDYRKGAWLANHGYRIDHFLLSPQAADLLKEIEIDFGPRAEDKPSDHAPIWIKIE